MKKRRSTIRTSKLEPSEVPVRATHDAESKRATLVQLIGRLLARSWLRRKAEINDTQDIPPDNPGPGPV